ncbi:hypothetical protein KY339_01885, partial [Candidatus Woesearchaeota archaeon]|nr:hypothetical protein [Candidatus Woesearchaeota archaeon]
MKKLKYLPLVFLAALPSVYAQRFATGRLLDTISRAFRLVFDFFQRTEIVYGVTVILTFVLFYAIYVSAAARVRIFGEEGKANKQGKILAFVLAAMTTMSIFYFGRQYGMTVMLSRILEPFGIFGGLMLGLVVFMIVYFGMRQDFPNRAWQIGLAAAGMGMVFFGFLLNRDDVTGIGWLLALIAAIIAFVGVIRGAPSPPGEATPTRPPTPPPRPPTTPGPRPGTVHTVRAQGSPHGRPLEATVVWETRPAEENVVRYEIEYWPSSLGGRLNPRRLRRRNRVFNAGAGEPLPGHPEQRQARIPLRTIGQWNFRVSAVNNIGNSSDWSNVVACFVPQPGPRRGELEVQVIYDGGSDDRSMWRYLSSIRVHIMDEGGNEGAHPADTPAAGDLQDEHTGTVSFDNLPEGIYFVSTEDLLDVYQEFDG